MKVKPSIHLNSLAKLLDQSTILIERAVLDHFKQAGRIGDNYRIEHAHYFMIHLTKYYLAYWVVDTEEVEKSTRDLINNINNLIIEP